jgi:hypothetical protein
VLRTTLNRARYGATAHNTGTFKKRHHQGQHPARWDVAFSLEVLPELALIVSVE